MSIVFSYTVEIFVAIYMQNILDYIPEILNISLRDCLSYLNIMENVDIFCFSRQLTWLGSDCKVQSEFYGLKFQCQFNFQCYLKPFPCVIPSAQSGTWAEVYPLTLFSKSFLC